MLKLHGRDHVTENLCPQNWRFLLVLTKLMLLREDVEIINSRWLSALERQSVPWIGTAWASVRSLLVPTRLAPTQLHIPVPHLDEGHRNSPFMPASPVSKHMAVEHLEKARELTDRVGT